MSLKHWLTFGPVGILFVILSMGMPLALWYDLDALTRQVLERKNGEVARLIDTVRMYYSDELIPQIQPGSTEDKLSHPKVGDQSSLPIPSTFTLELASRITAAAENISYHFVSDHPFKHRHANTLQEDWIKALVAFRKGENEPIKTVSGDIFNRKLTTATPVYMTETCVACHNSHPDSPKTDWMVGDVRGIQVIVSRQSLIGNLSAFHYLVLFFTVSGGLIVLVFAIQSRLSRRLQLAHTELSNAHSVIKKDLEGASDFQQSLLPKTFPYPQQFETELLYMPAREVGGDLIDLINLNNGHLLAVASDVSDKGVKAAFFAALAHSAMRDASKKIDRPDALLQSVNNKLFRNNAADLFVTCACAIIHPESGTFTLSSAGHCAPVIRRVDGQLEVLKLRPCLPLGLFEDITPQTIEGQLQPGEMFCLYTDGATDCLLENGEMLGTNGLFKLIEEARTPSEATARVKAICTRTGSEQFDDVAFVAVQKRSIPLSPAM